MHRILRLGHDMHRAHITDDAVGFQRQRNLLADGKPRKGDLNQTLLFALGPDDLLRPGARNETVRRHPRQTIRARQRHDNRSRRRQNLQSRLLRIGHHERAAVNAFLLLTVGIPPRRVEIHHIHQLLLERIGRNRRRGYPPRLARELLL